MFIAASTLSVLVPTEAIRASGVDLVGTICLFFYAVPTELKTGATLFL